MAIYKLYKLGDICKSISESQKSSIPQKILNTSDIYKGQINTVIENVKVLGQFKKTAKIEDILFSEIRPGNGRWALVEKDISDHLISTKLMVLRADTNVVLSKFLYILLTLTLQHQIVKRANSRSGTFPQITYSEISNLKIKLPSLSEQQKIIDIIEPIENIIVVINKQKDLVKKILINIYEIQEKNIESLTNNIKLLTSKWNGQTKYLATNAVSEFFIEKNKTIDVSNKRPSRANISPIENTFIISKLSGENKIYFFDEKPEEVFSTGFYNFSTKYVDYITGFLLSNSFKMQKENFSTGTTMQGINLEGLKKITMNRPNIKSDSLTKTISKLTKLEDKFNTLKLEMVNLLVK